MQCRSEYVHLSNQLISLPLNYDTPLSVGNGMLVYESEVFAVSVGVGRVGCGLQEKVGLVAN